jgi:uncharacterized membrane protein (GlpM family)
VSLWVDVAEVAAKTLLGGCLVVAFAILAQTLSPKRFAGVFAAAPSVALASLAMTDAFDGATDARRSCVGMAAGAVGFIVYALIAPSAMQRLGTLRGSVLSLTGWFAVTAAVLPLVALLPAAKAANGSVLASVAGASVRRAKGRAAPRPHLRFDAAKAKEASARDIVVRFAFGAGTSALAGVVSLLAGPTVGGVFLAFPSILLASLTLIADEEGRSKARDDARGAAAGALGLLCFAAVGVWLFTEQPPLLAFVAASLAWVVAGVGSFLVAWRAGYGADERQQRG